MTPRKSRGASSDILGEIIPQPDQGTPAVVLGASRSSTEAVRKSISAGERTPSRGYGDVFLKKNRD